jgi:phage-related tail protein
MIVHDPNQSITKGWHLDKRITVSHLFTTLAFAVALGSALYALDVKVTMNTNDIETNKKVAEVQHATLQLQIEQIKAAELAEIMQASRDNAEVIRRLERIEDGVNSHIRATERQHPDKE